MNYLVPANSKKSQLIFGFMEKADLIILIVGTIVTFGLIMSLPIAQVWAIIIVLIPAFFTAFLIFPIPNYHNARVMIGEMYQFYFVRRRKYIWRGWCYQYDDDASK